MSAPLDPFSSLFDVSDSLRHKLVSSVEVTRQTLERIERYDPLLLCFNAVTAEHALSRARHADAEIARGLQRGPLHGVPVAVKDLCNTTFAPTSAGRYIHRHFVAPENATVVSRLEEAGAIIVGKLALTEARSQTPRRFPSPEHSEY